MTKNYSLPRHHYLIFANGNLQMFTLPCLLIIGLIMGLEKIRHRVFYEPMPATGQIFCCRALNFLNRHFLILPKGFEILFSILVCVNVVCLPTCPLIFFLQRKGYASDNFPDWPGQFYLKTLDAPFLIISQTWKRIQAVESRTKTWP